MISNTRYRELSYIEQLNVITHGLSFLLVLITAPLLVIRACNFDYSILVILSVIGFLIGTLIMFGTSTKYHYSIGVDQKIRWRLADHIGIYIMIAGSYSPFMAIYFWHPKGQFVLVAMWVMALLGSIFKWFTTGKFNLLSTLLYVLMGLSIVWVSDAFFPLVPESVKHYLFLGGLFYLVGVVFYLLKQWTYHHPVWHLFVIGGAFSHWWALWLALT